MQTIALLAVLLFAAVAGTTAVAALQQEVCAFYPNQNMPSAPDFLKQITVSSSQCCELCAKTPQCVAAVFDTDYACHLKNTTVGTAASIDHTVILPGTTFAPQPATPEPTRSVGPFGQKVCSDSKCTANCNSSWSQLGECDSLIEGGSGIFVCTQDALIVIRYPNSAKCTGITINVTMPVNTCLASFPGTGAYYFENFCATDTPAPMSASSPLSSFRLPRLRKQ